MTDLTTAWSAMPRSLRKRDRRALRSGERGLIRIIAGRRREIVRVLNKVDDRLLRDAGIERANIEEFVDVLMARWR